MTLASFGAFGEANRARKSGQEECQGTAVGSGIGPRTCLETKILSSASDTSPPLHWSGSGFSRGERKTALPGEKC